MRYRLKLSKLDFCSLVDDPAQPNAKTLLIKRKGKRDEIEATARLTKVNDELGLAFFWAFTSTNPDGTDHFDLHGDAIDADFIKAAMDFMLEGGAVDEMHDGGATDGRVVFAMPMTPEIASAYGITTKQSGLMIAIKATADQLAKLKDGTYSGVSIAGWGTREPIAARKGRVCKANLYTNEVDGHQHQILCYEDGTFWVQHATAAGAEQSHSHGIVFEGGQLVILADSGHSHELAEDQPGLVVVPAGAVVVVAARAPQSKSTPPIASRTVNPTTEKSTMATDDTKQLEKQNHGKLDEIEKSVAEMRKALDAEVELRKKAEADLNDARARLEETEKIAKAEREQRELVELKKRADATLGALAGADDAHVALLKAVESIADEAQRKAALTTLKAANTVMLTKGAAPGLRAVEDPKHDDPQVEWDREIEKIKSEEKVDRFEATARLMKTARGAQLYAAITTRVKNAR